MASDKSGHLVGRRDGNTKKFHKFAAFKKINNTKWELDGAKSHLRDKEAFLATEETTIRSFEVGVGGVSMGECMSKLAVEDLEFLVIPSVHRAGFVFWGGRSGLCGVRVGFQGCISNGG